MSTNDISLKGQMTRSELAGLLEDMLQNFKQGTICISKGEECVTLPLAEGLEYAIETQVKKDKYKLSIELKWEHAAQLILCAGSGRSTAKMPDASAQPAAVAAGIGITGEEAKELTHAWHIKQGILGKDVYNEAREKVGIVEDLIVTPENAVSYAVVGAGGFLGLDKHDVCIPVRQLKITDKHILLPGATKKAVKAMPPCNYLG